MTPVTYRAAIIGTGRVASLLERDPLRSKPHTHAGWYARCPRTTLVAGCDLRPDRREAFAGDWGLPAGAMFADYRTMLDQVRPDIVSICGYAPERRAMVEAAVAAGARGLWIEKAVACSLVEADAIAGCLARAGVAAVVDQPRRGDPRYLAAQRIIADGDLGALRSVHCLFSGHIVHTGVHAWDALRLWLGEWQSASAWLDAGNAPGTPAAPDDATAAAFDLPSHVRDLVPPDALGDRGGHAHVIFDGGVHAFVSAAARHYFVFQFDLLFERGRLRLGNDIEACQTLAPSPRYSGFVELGPPRSLSLDEPPRPMVDDLVHAIDTGEPTWMSLDHASAAFALAVALFQSDRDHHRPVTPAALRRDLYIASV